MQPTEIKGRTQIVEPGPVESDGITRLSWGVCFLIWLGLLTPIWGGVVALLLWVLQ